MTFDDFAELNGFTPESREYAIAYTAWEHGFQEAYREIFTIQADTREQFEKNEMARIKNFKALL